MVDVADDSGQGPARPRSKQYAKPGQDKCFVCGGGDKDSIQAVTLFAEASLALKLRGVDRCKLPKWSNKLCPACRPALPDHKVLDTDVAVIAPDRRKLDCFAHGQVKGLSESEDDLMGNELFSESRQWRVEWSGEPKGPETLSTEEVGEASLCFRAMKRCQESAARREREQMVREQAVRADEPQPDEPTTDETARHTARTPASPQCAPAAAPTPAEPLIKHKRLVRLPLPQDAQPGRAVRVTVPAGFLHGSPEQQAEFIVPADGAPGQMVRVHLWVAAPEAQAQPPNVPRGGQAPRRGRGLGPGKAADLRTEMRASAEAAGLPYEPQPNSLNPLVAWPLRPCLSFATLKPGYFGLPGRGRLFKEMFGFSTWALAEAFFRTAFKDAWEGKHRSLLHPFFQYLAALWRMRASERPPIIAAFFGVTNQIMSDYLNEWIPRLGMFAKVYLVYLPKMETITALMPRSFIDCKMDKVVLIGDCKDHLVEQVRNNLVASADQHSSKSDAAVAMGQQWCTPIGLVGAAADLVFGRSSEQNVSALVGRLIFKDIPMEYSLAYDRGVAKLRLHLPNLNQVLTPCFLRQAARFTVEQGIRNRGITCNRYIVEVVFARETAWRFLGGVCCREDFHLLNWVWWWSLGFQNLVHKPLKPPAL